MSQKSNHCDCDKCEYRKMQYARAYVLPQKYENLFPVNIALRKGTIFRDLYMPYYEDEESKC